MEERERRQIQREKIRKFANLYLSKRACPCGVSDQEILIFIKDGRRVDPVRLNIYPSENGIKKLYAELQECDVMCWNCYMKLKANQGTS